MAAKLHEISPFQATALDAIPVKAEAARSVFHSNRTKDVEWRRLQLRKLYWAIQDYKPHILEALQRDLRKSPYESMLTEIDFLSGDVLYMLDRLDKFAKDEKPADVPFAFGFNKLRIRKEPLGAALIIGPFNFPLMLLLCPLLGAIAAGCTAILKPSELTPSIAMVVKDMIEARLDPHAYSVVNGSVAEVNVLMDEKWDKIFFTGSITVGTIIARKAAETLTPITLELGGRNPAFVTTKANLKLAARRLMWAKTMNAGQVCISPNYVMVQRDVVDAFIQELRAQHKELFPQGAQASPDLVRIVNARHFNRIKNLLDSTDGKVVMGGEAYETSLFIEPTAVLVNSADDPLLHDEIFGPIFSILAYDSLDEALRIANDIQRTPLALYTFGAKCENEKILSCMTSGGASINDSCTHASINTVPFGGVGESGTGAYRGKASFDSFSHYRTIAETPAWLEPLLRVRYMPYAWRNYKLIQRLTARRVSFDRDGRASTSWPFWLLGLGGSSAKGASIRWLAVMAVFAAYVTRAKL